MLAVFSVAKLVIQSELKIEMTETETTSLRHAYDAIIFAE